MLHKLSRKRQLNRKIDKHIIKQLSEKQIHIANKIKENTN